MTNFILSDVVSIPLASQSMSGLLSSNDKTKLDGINIPDVATSEEIDNLTETDTRLFSPAQIKKAVVDELTRSTKVAIYTKAGTYVWHKPNCTWVRVISFRPTSGIQDQTFKADTLPNTVNVNVPIGFII